MKIAEIFESIQGEGSFAGYPMLFIRTSGCNRNCSFCDTQYHKEGKDYTIESLIEIVKNSKQKTVCFTGGEPLLQFKEIKEIIEEIHRIDINYNIKFHLETNGDLLRNEQIYYFDYISCSPKEEKIAKKIANLGKNYVVEFFNIKVVTDLERVGVDMIKYATSLMPLSIFNKKEDLKIKQKVWDYCVKNNLIYSPRIHVDVWGNAKNI